MHTLTLVDDDYDIRELLSSYLEKNGFVVNSYASAEAMLAADHSMAELLILDVTLPGMDGLQLCREIRQHSDIPIIMLTAASDDVDRILGLELGADDYMGKPFNPRELLARIKALLRRAVPKNSAATSPALELDSIQRSARLNGELLNLTGAEFDLLKLFAEQVGEVISRDQLSIRLKGHPAAPYDRSIDTLVSRLRAKLMQKTDIDPIKAVRGKGYSLVVL